MAKLNDQQSQEARTLLNDIIAALTGRAADKSLSRATFEWAYESVFQKKPAARIKHDQESAYRSLFRIPHHYLDDPPHRPLRNHDHINRAVTALCELGYRSSVLLDKNDPRTWIKYLDDLLKIIKEHLPAEPSQSDEGILEPISNKGKAILKILDAKGRAAIVGKPDQCRRLAQEVANTIEKRAGWEVATCDAGDRLRQPLSIGITPEDHNYVSIWLDIFCQLIKARKKRNDKAWRDQDKKFRRFVEDWRWIGQGKDPLTIDERTFVTLIAQARKSGNVWQEFCTALKEYRSEIQNPTLILDLAEIMRIGAAKSLIILHDIYGFNSARKTVEALFGSPEASAVWTEFRLLVTCEEQACPPFLEHVVTFCELPKTDAGAQRAEKTTDNQIPATDPINRGLDKLVLDDPRAAGQHLRETARLPAADESPHLGTILRVELDEATQRIEQRLKRLVTDAANNGAAAVAAVRDRALRAESQTLALLSRQATATGDSMKGMLLALEALPKNTETPARPVVLDAVMALLEAFLPNNDKQIQLSYARGDWYATLSPDGRRVASPWCCGVAIWDLDDRPPTVERDPDTVLDLSDMARNFQFSQDARRLVATTFHGTAWVCFLDGPSPVATVLDEVDTKITCASISADGRRVLTGSEDGTVRVWCLDGPIPVATLLKGHTKSIRCASFSPDERRVLTASQDGTARIWSLHDPSPVATVLDGLPKSSDNTAFGASFSPDGRCVLTASEEGTARLWSFGGSSPEPTILPGHSEVLRGASFSRDGFHIVTVSDTTRVWTLSGPSPIATVLAHPYQVWEAAFSPDGSRVVTTCPDWTVRMWDLSDRVPISILLMPAEVEEKETNGYPDLMLHAEFSPDGQKLLTSSQTSALIWPMPRFPALALLARRALTRDLTEEERKTCGLSLMPVQQRS
jgi:WD40 repeat protein